MNKFKVGDVIYINNPWLIGKECEVMGYIFDTIYNNYIYEVKPLHTKGEFKCVAEEDIYLTNEDALNAYTKVHNMLVNDYKDKIKTIKDLVEFPLNYNLHEENPYHAVQDAYIDRCRDLLNVTIMRGLQND